MIGSSWAERAASLYDGDYARRYRAHDDELDSSRTYQDLAGWLRSVCERFTDPIDVLDLGCGTGRYFSALSGVRELTGLDASAAMLAEARRPYHASDIRVGSIALVEGDLLSHEFVPGRFALVYAIGVLAEHVPFDRALASRVAGWLRPDGRFAFTTVHPQSSSIPRTVPRWVGERIVPLTGGAVHERLRRRLLSNGLYADEERIREVLDGRFEIESLERFESEAHLHCLCVARRRSQ